LHAMRKAGTRCAGCKPFALRLRPTSRQVERCDSRGHVVRKVTFPGCRGGQILASSRRRRIDSSPCANLGHGARVSCASVTSSNGNAAEIMSAWDPARSTAHIIGRYVANRDPAAGMGTRWRQFTRRVPGAAREQSTLMQSILLVDDDAVLCDRLGRALRDGGYDVRTAANYEDALIIPIPA
jgi:hypothetical protein